MTPPTASARDEEIADDVVKRYRAFNERYPLMVVEIRNDKLSFAIARALATARAEGHEDGVRDGMAREWQKNNPGLSFEPSRDLTPEETEQHRKAFDGAFAAPQTPSHARESAGPDEKAAETALLDWFKYREKRFEISDPTRKFVYVEGFRDGVHWHSSYNDTLRANGAVVIGPSDAEIEKLITMNCGTASGTRVVAREAIRWALSKCRAVQLSVGILQKLNRIKYLSTGGVGESTYQRQKDIYSLADQILDAIEKSGARES